MDRQIDKVRQGSPGTMFVNDTVICGGGREPIQLEKCPGGGGVAEI